MCGIAGIHVFNPDKQPLYNKMENAIDSLLMDIDHRGGDATGFVAIGEEGNIEHQKASCNAMDFYKERRGVPLNTRSVLLHTRMATQGSAAFPENNHPVRRGSVYIVHNGHIWNDWEIFRKANRQRYGQVDSEAIAALIAKYGIMNTHKAMEELSGAAAIGVVDETRPGLMVLARGSSSPLMFYRNEDIAVFASEKHAVAKAWKILFGTPPKEKHIEDINEGVALYLDSDVAKKHFTPDDYYYSRVSSGTTVYGGTYLKKSGNSSHKWYDVCEKDGCYKEAKFTTDTGNIRLCDGHGLEYKFSPGDFSLREDEDIEFSVWCKHNTRYEDCIMCYDSEEDENGSFLPAIREHVKPEDFVNAKRCELCEKFFPEDDMTTVTDWDDNWVFCDSCLTEISEAVADNEVTSRQGIHREIMEDIESVNYVLTDDGSLYPA